MNLKSFIQISNLSSLTKAPLYPLMHVLDLSGSPLAKDLQVKIGFSLHCRNNREPGVVFDKDRCSKDNK